MSSTIPPNPANIFYDDLFKRRDKAATLEVLSSGLYAIVKNAELLLSDAKLLLDSQRYARAYFVISTADEEMAKSYIILDACRLNFDLHEGPLRCLCRAFYRHVEKYAYNKVYRGDIRNIVHAKEIFHIELQRWWPSGVYESGEPDMPHHTYFTRESNLYVDYIDFDQSWWIPSNDHARTDFEMMSDYDPFSESHRAFTKIKTTLEEGFFKPESLHILNDIFKACYIRENTNSEQLSRLYDTVAIRIEGTLGIPRNEFNESILSGWPLYDFLQTGP